MRILMIEDDKELCENISLMLKASGYETDTCYTGSDGLFHKTLPMMPLFWIECCQKWMV